MRVLLDECVPRSLRRELPDHEVSTVAVPVQTLLDYLEGGESLDAFLEGFPSVSRELAITFLKEAKLLLNDDIVRDTIEKTRR